MKILQTVNIKERLTDNSKERLINNYKEQQFQLKKEIEQLRFEMKKQQRNNKAAKQLVEDKFMIEINKRLEKNNNLNLKLDQLNKLPIGSEIKISECQALVEIKEGDHWDSKITNRTIIIKDGIVEEIR